MIHALDGPVMPYAWGSHSALARLLGRTPSGQPEAELWLGTHPGGPARLVAPFGGALTLSDLIARDPVGTLGSELAKAYERLPFLLKILAIEQPLSLQAHPSLEQARAGYLRENARGIDLLARNRNYRDDNHKPELLLALEPVEALCGFRAHDDALAQLASFGLARAESPLCAAVRAFGQGDDQAKRERFFRSLFELDRSALAMALGMVRSAAESRAPAGPTAPSDFARVAEWVLRLWNVYGDDPGLLAVLLLRLIHLEPGEALFLPAGRLHAYLSGVGVEIMAASDNVLRGGLTPKHVDVDELCRVLDFRPSAPDLLSPFTPPGAERTVRVFRGDASEFELWMVELEPGADPIEIPSPSLFVVLSGEVEVTQGEQRQAFERGGQAFCSWLAQPTWLSGQGRVALATHCHQSSARPSSLDMRQV